MTPILCEGQYTTQQVLAYIVMAVAIVLMTIATRRRIRERGKSPEFKPSEQIRDVALHRGIRNDMEHLLVELQDLSRKISAQVDTKFAKLEVSIADADRRIAELKRLLGETNVQTPDPVRRSGGFDVTVGDDRDGAARPAHRLVAAESPPSPDERRARIYQLADAGKSAVEIAQAVGQTPGEIELTLSLRPKH